MACDCRTHLKKQKNVRVLCVVVAAVMYEIHVERWNHHFINYSMHSFPMRSLALPPIARKTTTPAAAPEAAHIIDEQPYKQSHLIVL